jgi:ABC-2 type transport system permease protein
MIGQILFRGIYWFRNEIITGHFDLTLTKPISPLFSAMTDKTDLLDIPLLLFIIYFLLEEIKGYPLINIVTFLLIGIIGFLIIAAIHILVACLGILTTEVDHVIWIYRDLSTMVRFPVDIYESSIRFFLTYVIPVGIIFTFPAKALMGLLSWQGICYSFLAVSVSLFLSLKLWQWSLKKYSSASS